MCQAIDELVEIAEKKGRKEGKIEGRKEGEIKGEKKGIKETKKAIVLELLKLGQMSRTAIAKVVHLPYATVKKLAETQEA